MSERAAHCERLEPAPAEALLAWFRDHFEPEAARGLRAHFLVDLGDSVGIHLHVDDGRLRVVSGATGPADLTLRLSERDLEDLQAGRENPELLHMAGRLEVEGQLALANPLRRIFRRRA